MKYVSTYIQKNCWSANMDGRLDWLKVKVQNCQKLKSKFLFSPQQINCWCIDKYSCFVFQFIYSALYWVQDQKFNKYPFFQLWKTCVSHWNEDTNWSLQLDFSFVNKYYYSKLHTNCSTFSNRLLIDASKQLKIIFCF